MKVKRVPVRQESEAFKSTLPYKWSVETLLPLEQTLAPAIREINLSQPDDYDDCQLCQLDQIAL
jgi:hypothetical protein